MMSIEGWVLIIVAKFYSLHSKTSTIMAFIRATAVLVGTVVGAGIFGLPYAFVQSGFIPGIFYLIILAVIFLIVNLSYGEVVLRTKKRLEMPGYSQRYLGKWGKIIITVSLMLGIYGALIAYTIGVGGFLYALLSPIIGGSQMLYSIIFWALGSIIILHGVGIVSRLEVVMALGLILAVIFIFIYVYPSVVFDNLKIYNFSKILFPFGVVLFALGGASAVPTMRRILAAQVHLLKRSIIIGSIVPVFIYIIFAFSVIGVSGIHTTETAITGLANVVNGKILLIGGVFGILAMSTSFLALGYILRQVWHEDYNIPLIPAWMLTVFIPLGLFLLGLKSFVAVIGFAGSILSGMQGIILISAFYKAKKTGDRGPEFSISLAKPIAYIIYAIFIFGILYQFVY